MSEYRKVSVSKCWDNKYPEQIVVVTTVDSQDKPNAITLGWTMITSNQPPMMAISVGHTHYSYELLKGCREFVLGFPNETAIEKVKFCGTNSGRDFEDKLKECNWETEPAEIVKPPLLTKCIANFECKVVNTLKTGDHTIFVGEVVVSHLAKSIGQRIYNLGSGIFKAINSR